MTRLLITHCSTLGASETFIRAHIEKLPFETTFIHQLPPKRVELSTYIPGDGAVVDALKDYTSAYLTLIEEIQPDLVLAEYGPSGVAILEACRSAKLPLVVHFHGFDASMTKVLQRYHDGYLDLFHYASSIIVVSHAMKEKLTEIGAPESKIKRIPYGVDLSFFSPNPFQESRNFLFVGRLVEKKDPLLLLEAFHSILQSHPDSTLTLAGDGPLRPACEAFIAQHPALDRHLTLLGHCTHDAIRTLYQKSYALVVPSCTASSGDSEGLPNCILEAMANARPVIGTSHAGIPDAVLHEETGLLVEPRSLPELSNAMNELLDNPEKAQSMGKAARKRVEAIFSQENTLGALSETLHAAMKSAPSSESA
jgi:colanic acid/amylovoran biosynthesis glycosyltransferase